MGSSGRTLLTAISALTLVACGDDAGMTPDGGGPGDSGPGDAGGPTGLAVLGGGTHSADAVEVVVIATEADELATPRDLAFRPDADHELWVVNFANHSTTILFGAGSPTQMASRRSGPGSEHFLSKPSCIAFGAPGTMATAHEEDEVTQPTTPADFMGPVLWTTDLTDFDAGHHGHLDMLHNSPNAVGIAWEDANVYWVFDGYHSSITRYDFHMDHGLGGEDHTDGEVYRHVEGQVGYVEGVASHMELDRASGLLYIADSGNNRIALLDTFTGTPTTPITPNYDGSTQFMMEGSVLTTLVDGATAELTTPSGLALRDGTLYVTDNATSRITAFDLGGQRIDWLDLASMVPPGGLQGIELDPEGRIYVIDTPGNRILRIAPL
jgi:hypothetical protein